MSGEQLSIYPSSEPIQKKVPNLADFLGAKNLLNEKNHDAHSRLMTEFATSNNFPQYNSPEYKKLREQKAQEEKTKPLDQYFGGEGKLTKMSTTFYEKGIDIAPTLEHYKDIINTHLARPANSNLTNMEYEQLIANIKKLITNTLLSNNDLLSDITDINPQWIISNAINSSTEKINSSLIPSAYFLLEMHSGDNMEKYTNLRDNSTQARRHIKMRDREISESLLTAKIGDNEEIPTGLIGNDSFFSMSGEENMRGDNYLKYIKFNQTSIADIRKKENPSLLNEEYKTIENKANIAMMAFAVASMIPYAGAAISLPFDIKDIFSKENALVEFLKGRNAIDPRYNPGKEGYEHILALGSVVAMPIGAQGVFKTPKVLELMEKIRKIKIDPKIFSDIIGQIADIFHMDKNTLNSLFNSDNSMQTTTKLTGSSDSIPNGATKSLENLDKSQSGMVVEGTRSRVNKIEDLPKAIKLNEDIRAEALSRGVNEDIVRKEWIMRDFGYNEAQADAVIRAHHIQKAGESLGNYGPESLGEKIRIMEAAGVDYRLMLKLGYAGGLQQFRKRGIEILNNTVFDGLGKKIDPSKYKVVGLNPEFYTTGKLESLAKTNGEIVGGKYDGNVVRIPIYASPNTSQNHRGELQLSEGTKDKILIGYITSENESVARAVEKNLRTWTLPNQK